MSCFLRVKSLLDKYLLGVERPSTCKYLIPGTENNTNNDTKVAPNPIIRMNLSHAS